MWHILLLILKLIGMILVIILCIVFMSILFVLFLPVHYKIAAKGRLGGEKPFWADIRIHWLFHIVNASFVYPDKPYLCIKLFCFRLFDPNRVKKERKRKRKPVNKEAEIKPAATVQDAVAEKSDNMTGEISQDKIKYSDTSKPQEDYDGKFPLNLIHKLKDFYYKIIHIITNIEYTLKRICDTIKNVIENIRYYLELLESDAFKQALNLLKKQLTILYRSLKPQKCSIHLKAGTGDPASTGQILAVYGMLYPFLGRNVAIEADFENKVLEGEALIKGRINIITLVQVTLKLYTDKNIRNLLKRMQKEES